MAEWCNYYRAGIPRHFSAYIQGDLSGSRSFELRVLEFSQKKKMTLKAFVSLPLYVYAPCLSTYARTYASCDALFNPNELARFHARPKTVKRD